MIVAEREAVDVVDLARAASGMPGSTISLPVERIATEGLANDLDLGQPERRERADAAGVEHVTGAPARSARW